MSYNHFNPYGNSAEPSFQPAYYYPSSYPQALYPAPPANSPGPTTHQYYQTSTGHYAYSEAGLSPTVTAHSPPHSSCSGRPSLSPLNSPSTPGSTLFTTTGRSCSPYSSRSTGSSPGAEYLTPYLHQRDRSPCLQDLNDPEDPTARPRYSNKTLCQLAITGSPEGKLTLQGIYSAVEARFPSLRSPKHQDAWRDAARHDISKDYRFVKVPRPILDPGRGHYWTYDAHAQPKEKPRRSNSKAGEMKLEQAPTPQPIVISTKMAAATSRSRRGSVSARISPQSYSDGSNQPPSRRSSWLAHAAANPYLPQPNSTTNYYNPYSPNNTYGPPSPQIPSPAAAAPYTVRYQPYTRRSSQTDQRF